MAKKKKKSLKVVVDEGEPTASLDSDKARAVTEAIARETEAGYTVQVKGGSAQRLEDAMANMPLDVRERFVHKMAAEAESDPMNRR